MARFTDVLEVLQAITTHPDQSVQDTLAVGMCELKLVYFMVLYFLEVASLVYFRLECGTHQLVALVRAESSCHVTRPASSQHLQTV